MDEKILKEFLKLLKEEESIVGDVFQGDPLEKRSGKQKLSASISDKSIIDLFAKIMKGGFWVSKSKASESEVMAYQKFLSSLNYDIDIDGDYGKETKKITKELQADLFAKEDGIFGKDTLSGLISQLKENNIKSDRASFNTAFPDSTTGMEVVKWLTSQYDLVGSEEKKETETESVDTSDLEVLISNQKGPKGRKLYSYQVDFFKSIVPPIVKVSGGNNKIFASITIAQAALETGWGRKTPGGNSNNLFGFKRFPKNKPNKYWDGSYVDSKTKEEFKPGEITNIVSAFRKYSSKENSVKDHNRLLNTSKNYAGVRAASTLEAQIDALHKSPYATDNEYGTKLKKLINDYKLYKYDIGAKKGSSVMSENKKILKSFIRLLKSS